MAHALVRAASRLFSTPAACLLTLAVSAAGATPPKPTPHKVTFNPIIARILYKNCTPCHRPGEAAPFSILSYENAKRHAFEIAAVTKSRFMPPWLPEEGYGDFKGARYLTAKQIALIGEWVKQGRLEGPTANAPVPPKFSSIWELGPPDMILHVAHPYKLYAAGPEVFWNFVLPVPLKNPRWVRAVAIRPGNNPRVFHHANAIIDRMGVAQEREVEHNGGFPGMDLTVRGTTVNPDGYFLSWKPGSKPVEEPPAWLGSPHREWILSSIPTCAQMANRRLSLRRSAFTSLINRGRSIRF